jgi:hypothetical protein
LAGDVHRGSVHAEHLAQKLLGERKLVAIDTVLRHRQPARHPGLDRMHPDASGALRDHRDQRVRVVHQERPQLVDALDRVVE